jgi:Rad/Gem-related GTP binding protein 1
VLFSLSSGESGMKYEPIPSESHSEMLSLSSICFQFMTSEYMHTYDASLDDEFGEKTVSILLDGEESELIFIDHPAIEMSVSFELILTPSIVKHKI